MTTHSAGLARREPSRTLTCPGPRVPPRSWRGSSLPARNRVLRFSQFRRQGSGGECPCRTEAGSCCGHAPGAESSWLRRPRRDVLLRLDLGTFTDCRKGDRKGRV
jgi:hypothetical protein